MKSLIVFLLIGLSLLSWQCSSDSAAEKMVQETKTSPVKVLKLDPKSFQEFLSVTGTLKAKSHVDIIIEEGGILQKLIRDKGDYVRKNDTLAVLDNPMIKAGYDEARAGLNQSRLDFDSKSVMYNKKAISENEYLSSKYGYERSRAMYDLARSRYLKLFIVSPISGYINNRYYDIGAYGMPMTPIYNMVDNSSLKVKAGVAERFLADIELGTPAFIEFDAYPDVKLDAVVSFISKSIQPTNRTFEIEINIANPKGKLAPEMIANVRLLRRSFENKIVVPLDALIESENGRHVFIAEQGKAVKKDVNILAIQEDSVLVEGLEENHRLIILGQRELSSGDLLNIVE